MPIFFSSLRQNHLGFLSFLVILFSLIKSSFWINFWLQSDTVLSKFKSTLWITSRVLSNTVQYLNNYFTSLLTLSISLRISSSFSRPLDSVKQFRFFVLLQYTARNPFLNWTLLKNSVWRAGLYGGGDGLQESAQPATCRPETQRVSLRSNFFSFLSDRMFSWEFA